MKEKGYDFSKLKSDTYGDTIYVKGMNEFEFRSNPILVETIEELKKEKESLDWLDYRKEYVSNLSVCETDLNLEVVDYYDGKERLEFNGREIYTI